MHHDTTPEEARVDLPEPRRLLARSGFGAAEPLFTADLKDAEDLAQAREVVAAHGSRLWTEATRTGLDELDDRPLYWARLALAARLRTWRPSFALDPAGRADLMRVLEVESRGITDLDFPPGERWVRVVVTGFDPFRLDEDPSCSNPSGAAALDLNGWTFPVGRRTAVVRAAIFPVRWADFDDGLVEQALAEQHERAEAVLTLSRGRSGRFDLEVWNGAHRGGGADNLGVRRSGTIPVPGGGPQWTRTSLPTEQMARAAAGPVPVRVNTHVVEGDPQVERHDGPTPGSVAVRGSGGDYLSNEIAYRNTLLRDRSERGLPSGHVHLPKEQGAEILEQTRALVAAAAESALPE
ncbi:pyroglutamyl peptidase [Nocardiopsis sp. HNM0947]|uniref:Pyroglutamyl peptidase n=1 Tax=Nocardiopsis coralli TaxID=2772213 RepID=A0ABR9PCN2_9ACTN|nr:pyroglutamyl peptidase [Nocardiopsis coralli]MBE3001593.1 pyroglutamyl peptidase [Nocardiopsis coralli]